MSVINQMLRDLDKRQALSPRDPILNATLQKVERRPSVLNWMLVLVLVVTLALGFRHLLPAQWTNGLSIETTSKATNPETRAAPETTAASPPQLVPAVDEQDTSSAPAMENSDQKIPEIAVVDQKSALMAHQPKQDEAPAPRMNADQSKVFEDSDQARAPLKQTVQEQASDESADWQAAIELESNDEVELAYEQESNLVTTSTLQREAFSSEQAQPQAAQESSSVAHIHVERMNPLEQELQNWQLQAQRAAASQQYDVAVNAWLQVIRLDPQHQDAYQQTAALLKRTERYTELNALMLRAAANGVMGPALSLIHLETAALQQQWAQVLVLSSQSLQQQYPNVVMPLRAHAQQQLKDDHGALETYQLWTQQSPSQARAWLGLALMLEKTAQTQTAQLPYRKALMLGGLSPQTITFIEQRLKAGGG